MSTFLFIFLSISESLSLILSRQESAQSPGRFAGPKKTMSRKMSACGYGLHSVCALRSIFFRPNISTIVMVLRNVHQVCFQIVDCLMGKWCIPVLMMVAILPIQCLRIDTSAFSQVLLQVYSIESAAGLFWRLT